MRLLITGAGGFVGSALVRKLDDGRSDLVALSRKAPGYRSARGKIDWVGKDLEASENPMAGMGRVDAVVHLAARVHLPDGQTANPMDAYREVNVRGTLKLARDAARHGAGRFVYVSSIGVNGNRSLTPFTVDHPPAPVEPYAISKMEAEICLAQTAAETGMETVIIRPPLVYGPGAPGNFSRLLRVVASGVPLPFGAVRNKRSIVAVENLVDLIATCVHHPAAGGRTFLVSDGRDLSTPELIRLLARFLGRPARLLPVPPPLLLLLGRMIGKGADMNRLVHSLQVDISHTRETLGWSPPVGVERALARAAGTRTEGAGFSGKKRH